MTRPTPPTLFERALAEVDALRAQLAAQAPGPAAPDAERDARLRARVERGDREARLRELWAQHDALERAILQLERTFTDAELLALGAGAAPLDEKESTDDE